jgi:hypothetical protein
MVDKQLVAAQEDNQLGTDPAVQDQPAVQAKRRRHCVAHRCHWSGDAGLACSAGEEAALCCSLLSIWPSDAGLSSNVGEEAVLCCSPLSILSGVGDRPAVQVKRQR